MERKEPMDVEILYRNHRGEEARRRIKPIALWFGSTDWHPEEQWLLGAFDYSRNSRRDFSMAEIKEWRILRPDSRSL